MILLKEDTLRDTKVHFFHMAMNVGTKPDRKGDPHFRRSSLLSAIERGGVSILPRAKGTFSFDAQLLIILARHSSNPFGAERQKIIQRILLRSTKVIAGAFRAIEFLDDPLNYLPRKELQSLIFWGGSTPTPC
jgi:hypothetical protein